MGSREGALADAGNRPSCQYRGDGTILRCAQVVLGSEVPIVGVNIGKLGFMTECSESEAKACFSAMLSGEGRMDERTMIQVAVPTVLPGQPRTFHALNDIVVARGRLCVLSM